MSIFWLGVLTGFVMAPFVIVMGVAMLAAIVRGKE